PCDPGRYHPDRRPGPGDPGSECPDRRPDPGDPGEQQPDRRPGRGHSSQWQPDRRASRGDPEPEHAGRERRAGPRERESDGELGGAGGVGLRRRSERRHGRAQRGQRRNPDGHCEGRGQQQRRGRGPGRLREGRARHGRPGVDARGERLQRRLSFGGALPVTEPAAPAPPSRRLWDDAGMRAFSLLCAAVLPLVASAKPIARDLDKAVEAYAGAFNGVVLVADHGKVVYERPIGLAVREWGVKHTMATKFDIASMTKSFTAILILQLVERGKVRLDAKLSEYVPEYAHAGEITIHQLLTHTAGIPDYVPPLADQFAYCKPHKPLELVDLVAKDPLLFAPGSRFDYCNTCYILLGAVIEKVTGRPYGEVVQERILAPAGMTESGMDDSRRILPARAVGYIREDETLTRAPLIDMSVAHATGGLY